MYYSVIGLLAVLVLIIVNQDILLNPKASYNKPAWKVYRRFLFAVLVYYVTDILWGIIDSKKLSTALFIDTTIYFIAMAVGIALWAEYTVAYLDEKNMFGRFLTHTGHIFAGAITCLAIINIFVPVLFVIDDNCDYHAMTIRDVSLVCQIILLVTISVYCIYSMIVSDIHHVKRSRFRILASFGIIMAVCLFIQLLFPLLPIYSIAYMLGTCMLHTFVASDEKEENRRRQEENKKITELKNRFISIIDNMPGMTFTKDAKTGVYLACNQAFAEYAQKKNPDGVVGHTAAELFDAETAAHFMKDDKIALSLSKPYVYFEDVADAAGNPKQIQTTKIKYTDTEGNLCILGMGQDITDMIRIQHEQAMTQEAYEKAVSSGLMYTNIAQTLARDYIDLYYVNTDTEEYIQYCKGDEEETISEVRRGWHFFSDCKLELSESVYSEDREAFLAAMKRKTLMDVLKQKETFVITYRQMGDEGPFYVSMKISLMLDKKYIIIGITNVDAEMRETMASKEKEAVLADMETELRSPILDIIELNKTALENDDLDDETRGYLEKIAENSNMVLDKLNIILNQSREGSENK